TLGRPSVALSTFNSEELHRAEVNPWVWIASNAPFARTQARYALWRNTLGIDQHTGIEHRLRIKHLLRRLQRGSEERWPLLVVPRPMLAPNRVMMGDGAAGRDERVRGGLFDLLPHWDKRAVASERVEGEIRRGSIGIDMGEATAHFARTAGDAPDRFLGRG